MKKQLMIFALLISGVAMGQSKLTEAWPSYQLSKPISIGIRTVVPLHMFVIAGENTTLNLDFRGDSLVVSGNMKLSESGKMFIDFCRKYMKTKIDSLEMEIEYQRKAIKFKDSIIDKCMELSYKVLLNK